MSFPISQLSVGILLLLLGAASDVWKRRIPNALNAALGLAGLWAQTSARGWTAALLGLAAGIITVALLWVPWLKGRLGGGDVKMAGAAAVWMGLSLLPIYLLATAVAGGIVGVICFVLSSRAARNEIQANLVVAATRLEVPDAPIKATPGRRSVPYGVAVAMAAVAVLWTGGSW